MNASEIISEISRESDSPHARSVNTETTLGAIENLRTDNPYKKTRASFLRKIHRHPAQNCARHHTCVPPFMRHTEDREATRLLPHPYDESMP